MQRFDFIIISWGQGDTALTSVSIMFLLTNLNLTWMEFQIVILFVSCLFYFLLAKIVALAGYPAIRRVRYPAIAIGYPAGYRISKKAGYPVQP